jgi:hypothetical protein
VHSCSHCFVHSLRSCACLNKPTANLRSWFDCACLSLLPRCMHCCTLPHCCMYERAPPSVYALACLFSGTPPSLTTHDLCAKNGRLMHTHRGRTKNNPAHHHTSPVCPTPLTWQRALDSDTGTFTTPTPVSSQLFYIGAFLMVFAT